MSDKLNRWMSVYINALKAGEGQGKALELAGVSYDTVQAAEKDNAAFRNAVFLIDSGVAATMVTPRELMRLMEAQTPDHMLAGYFGMDVESFIAYVSADPELTRVYQTGRNRGLARLQSAVYDAALGGDGQLLKFTAATLLGMNEVQRVEVTTNKIDNIDELARVMQSLEERVRLQKKTIDCEAVEVDNTPEGDFTHGTTIDTDTAHDQ